MANGVTVVLLDAEPPPGLSGALAGTTAHAVVLTGVTGENVDILAVMEHNLGNLTAAFHP
jgi:hypothetical protein